MNIRRLAILATTLGVLACTPPAEAQVPAFPGAEGAGAFSIGGRGGRAIHVTNLNDSGPGSFRAALGASGPRTVIFDVGGTIQLRSPLSITNGRITIAGQTAPGGGITIRDHGLRIYADDVVIRFIRSRLGNTSGVSDDAISVVSGHRIMLDHVSTSWGTDETLSVSPHWTKGVDLRDVTVQWSIISESICGPRTAKKRHCYGSLVTDALGGKITYHHDLWAHHSARMPRPGNKLPPAQDPTGALLDFRSNVFYNWGSRQAGYDDGPAGIVKSNFVNNSYWSGPDTPGPLMYDNVNPFGRGWFAGNYYNGQPLTDQFSHVLSQTPGFPLSGPVQVAPVKPDPAPSAYKRVLDYAGASLVRDSVDQRVIATVRTRTGGLISDQFEVGGWPALARGTPWLDSDGDGLPDSWERQHSLNPADASDGARDSNGDGYTNLEEWLNELAKPVMPN